MQNQLQSYHIAFKKSENDLHKNQIVFFSSNSYFSSGLFNTDNISGQITNSQKAKYRNNFLDFV
jgi:hypothetical protein